MPLEKQSLNNFLPDGFETLNQEGYKENFDEDKIKTGYEKDVPDIISGPNLNNLIDVVGKNTNILNNYVEYLNGMPINNVPTVNKAGQLDYVENNFLNKNQITNCILEAPNGIATYSGSTLTAKQGLKFLSPDGLNTDGTLKNIEYNLSNDLSIDLIFNANDKNTIKIVYIVGNTIGYATELRGLEQDRPNTYKIAGILKYYATDTNKWYTALNNNAGNNITWSEQTLYVLGYIFVNSNLQIEKFIPNNTSILKQSDKSQISGWGMPSSKKIDLTLGASGTTYVAPANGWIVYAGSFSVAGRVHLSGTDMQDSRYSPANEWICATVPIRKGSSIAFYYDGTASLSAFKFVYAKGEV